MERKQLVRIARQMAERFGVDPDIYVRQIEKESQFVPTARNDRTGATGLAQVMSATAQDPGYGVTPLRDRLDPVESLRFGAEYMKAMLDKYDGDYNLALSAYNAGPGTVDQFKGVPDFDETRNYVSTILQSPLRPRMRPEPEGVDKQAIDDAVAEALIDPRAMSSANAAVQEYLQSGSEPDLRVPAPAGLQRTGQMSRMSPLSQMGIPGSGNIEQYSTPGGIESLYKR